MSNPRNDTLSFIQLIKAILEYYGTTKQLEKKEDLQEFTGGLDDAEALLANFDKEMSFIEELNSSGIFVEVPNEIDEEIRKTFIAQIKSFQNIEE